MLDKIKKNWKVIAKTTGMALAGCALYAVEVAGSLAIANKICEGCDEDNPANFWQTTATIGVLLGAGVVETATLLPVASAIETEIIDNWEEE